MVQHYNLSTMDLLFIINVVGNYLVWLDSFRQRCGKYVSPFIIFYRYVVPLPIFINLYSKITAFDTKKNIKLKMILHAYHYHSSYLGRTKISNGTIGKNMPHS